METMRNSEKMDAVKAKLNQELAVSVLWEAAWNPGTPSRPPTFDIGGKTMHGRQFYCYVPFSEAAFERMSVDELAHEVMKGFWEELSDTYWELKGVYTFFEDWMEQNA